MASMICVVNCSATGTSLFFEIQSFIDDNSHRRDAEGPSRVLIASAMSCDLSSTVRSPTQSVDDLIEVFRHFLRCVVVGYCFAKDPNESHMSAVTTHGAVFIPFGHKIRTNLNVTFSNISEGYRKFRRGWHPERPQRAPTVFHTVFVTAHKVRLVVDVSASTKFHSTP